ncbi:MAG: PEPxxWA-CTERM sorting domain-containing protein [Betaproteobacteria bacterium]|nr:PEPxxWA-CTERM sorting domain-containing protein [Betaproteobacteria bacterium]
MKHTKLTAMVAALVLASGVSGMAQAKIVEGVSLGAWDVVNEFNSMNNGKGLYFTIDPNHTGGSPFPKIDVGADYAHLLSVYPTDYYGQPYTYFRTMYAWRANTINANQVEKGVARLNYNGSTTSTNYNNTTGLVQSTLSVGAAYIYTMFVTEGMYGGPFANLSSTDNALFHIAWSLLTNRESLRLGSKGLSMWNIPETTSNKYLNSLLSINTDKSYWLAPYDPDKLYSEIGYYSVFVMDNRNTAGGASITNTLFVVDRSPSVIPEPETYAMMLAGLGLIGAMVRRRRSKGA